MRMPAWNLRRPMPGLRLVRAIPVPDFPRVLPDRAATALKRALAVSGACAFAALMVAAGLPVLHRLYAAGWVEARHYHVAFALLCVLPAAAAHAGAAYSGARGAAWWLAWLPGLAIYAAFPWPSDGTWRPLWIFGQAWDWARAIFSHWDTAGPFVFNSFGAFAGMTTVTLVVCGKLWFGAARAADRLGPGAVAASVTDAALPSASWASRREVLKRFNAPGGIVLGEMTDPVKGSPRFTPGQRGSWGGQGKGELITMSPEDGNGHVLVTSQASGYKSTGLVIPNILTYDGPIVVFDPKCELYARTWKARKAMEYEPVVIDANNGFDPARLIAALAADHPSAYVRLAKMLIPKGDGGIENAQYFKDAATNLFCALLGHFGGTGSASILQDIARILSQPPNEAHKELSEEMSEDAPPFVQNEINGLNGMDTKYWYSIKTEITNQLLFCSIPDVAQYITMEPESELPSQVIHPRCDIFLNIPQNVAEDFAPMLRVMLGSMLTAAELIEVNEDPRARRLFLIDEAAKLGAMDILENIRDRGRSRGLHLMMFYQTPGEIAKLWGRAGMTSWKDGCSATIMGPVSSRDSAGEISAMIGTRTLRVKTESTSSSSQVMSPMAGQVSVSEQEQLRDVPLLSPTAISQLPRHASIIKVPGEKAILASKAIWFTREGMRDRVRDTKQIKGELAVSSDQEALLDRLAEMSRTAKDGGEDRQPQPSGAEPGTGQRGTVDDAPSAGGDRPAGPDGQAKAGAGGRAQASGSPGHKGQALSEQAKAMAPRYGPETNRGGVARTVARKARAPSRDAGTAVREIDPGGVRIEEDVVAPFRLDGEDANGGPQPGPEAAAALTRADEPTRPEGEAGATVADDRKKRATRRENEERDPAREDEDEPGGDGAEGVRGPVPADNAGDGSGHPEAAAGAGKPMDDGPAATETPAQEPEAELDTDRGGTETPASEDAEDGPGTPETESAVETASDATPEAETAVQGGEAEPSGSPDAGNMASAKVDADAGDADAPESARQDPAEAETGSKASPSGDGGDGRSHRDAKAVAARRESETPREANEGGEAAEGSAYGDETAPPAPKTDEGPKDAAPDSGSAEDADPGDEGAGDWSSEEGRRALVMLQDGVPAEEIARTLNRGLAETKARIMGLGRGAMVPGGTGDADDAGPGNGQ